MEGRPPGVRAYRMANEVPMIVAVDGVQVLMIVAVDGAQVLMIVAAEGVQPERS